MKKKGDNHVNSNEIQYNIDQLKPEEKEQMENFIKKHQGLLATDFSELCLTSKAEHKIDTALNMQLQQNSYHFDYPRFAVKEHVKEMLKNEVIVPSNYTRESPIVLVKKNNC